MLGGKDRDLALDEQVLGVEPGEVVDVLRTVLDTNVFGAVRVTNAMLQTGPAMAACAPLKSMLNSVTAQYARRLATLPDGGPRGGFFDDNGVVPW
ncbi:hypothetical protein YIM_23755 [Amycolatopsis sp. YIM 10]|nr:hypothetical protein YIM_23755 [Amycolatopsis sp. YIM 10]